MYHRHNTQRMLSGAASATARCNIMSGIKYQQSLPSLSLIYNPPWTGLTNSLFVNIELPPIHIRYLNYFLTVRTRAGTRVTWSLFPSVFGREAQGRTEPARRRTVKPGARPRVWLDQTRAALALYDMLPAPRAKLIKLYLYTLYYHTLANALPFCNLSLANLT